MSDLIKRAKELKITGHPDSAAVQLFNIITELIAEVERYQRALEKCKKQRDYAIREYHLKRFPDVFDEAYLPTLNLVNKELEEILAGGK